jgi:hypothetical protein
MEFFSGLIAISIRSLSVSKKVGIRPDYLPEKESRNGERKNSRRKLSYWIMTSVISISNKSANSGF